MKQRLKRSNIWKQWNSHECKHSTSVVASIKYPLHMLQVICALTNFNGILLDFCCKGGDDDTTSSFIILSGSFIVVEGKIDFISFCFASPLTSAFADNRCCACSSGSVLILLRAIWTESDVTGAIVEFSNKKITKKLKLMSVVTLFNVLKKRTW